MNNSTTWTILHLTDIHFGDAYTDDDKIPLDNAYRENLKRFFPDSLRYFVAGLQDDPNLNPHTIFDRPAALKLPDALVVTGDLTIRGDPDAMNRCAAALFDLTNALRAVEVPVAVVPGNHDVDWRLTGTEPNYFNKKFDVFVNAIKTLKAQTCLIPVGGLQDHDLTFDPNFKPIVVDSRRKLVIICLNSAIRCGETNTKLMGEAQALLESVDKSSRERLLPWMQQRCVNDIAHITPEQRTRLARELSETMAKTQDWKSYLKVAVLHHHLVGMAGGTLEHKAFEMTVDAPQVLEMLADYDVDLVLTGHKHKPYAVRYVCRRSDGSDRDIVIAGGATVLGGLPKGVGAQGLNRVRAQKDANGALAVEFDVIDIAHELQIRQRTRSPAPHTRVSVLARSVLPGTHVRGVSLIRDPTESVLIDGTRHEPLRLYSGITLQEYCHYCQRLALNSKRLFTLLTIAPADLLLDICPDRAAPREMDAFLEIADKAGTHYKAYREHPDAVRVVIGGGDDWVGKNREALPYLKALNGGMRCFVVSKALFERQVPKVFLMDHTAVDEQVCMYDSSSYIMTVGPLAAMDTAGYGWFFSDPEVLRAQGFVPFDEFLADKEIEVSV